MNDNMDKLFSIYKYELEVEDRQAVNMPEDAEIISAQLQNQKICIWAKVNLHNKITESRIIRIIGTGQNFTNSHLKFISTVQMMDGMLVWHIFEETSMDVYHE